MQRAWAGCWGRGDQRRHLLLPLVRTWPGTLDDSAPLLLTVGMSLRSCCWSERRRPSRATCPHCGTVECVDPVATGQPDRPVLSKRAPPRRGNLARPAGPWASVQTPSGAHPRSYARCAHAPLVSSAVGPERRPTDPDVRSEDAALADSFHRVVGSKPALPCEGLP